MQPTQQSIDMFPVPWSQQLTRLIGKVTFDIQTEVQRFDAVRFLGIISSRQTQLGYAEQDWQAALLASLHLAHQQGWVVLIASDTPYFEIIEHACIRMKVAWMSLSVVKEPKKSDVIASHHKQNCLGVIRIVPESTEDTHPGLSVQDRSVVFLSDHLFALHVRKGGAIETLLHQRMEQPEIPSGSTYVAMQAPNFGSPTNSVTQKHLLEVGAIGWFVSTHTETSDDIEDVLQYRKRVSNASQLLVHLETLQKRSNRNYLIHATRARRGPWPDQSLSQFHDEIMHQPWTHKPSVMQTLIRILEQQRLIGTLDLRRSKKETVCFSERPIDQLPSMRRFQSHLRRWDWEPYGIMIEQEWLIEQGAKRVEYISPEEAKHRDLDSLMHCQVVTSHGGKHDWTAEQEWRIAGDLRLHRVPFEKCFVFVPNDLEARKIQRVSRWPILSLEKAIT